MCVDFPVVKSLLLPVVKKTSEFFRAWQISPRARSCLKYIQPIFHTATTHKSTTPKNMYMWRHVFFLSESHLYGWEFGVGALLCLPRLLEMSLVSRHIHLNVVSASDGTRSELEESNTGPWLPSRLSS